MRDLPGLPPGGQPAPGRLDVHLWQHRSTGRLRPTEVRTLLALLPDDERTRYAEMRDERRQEQYLIGRALCRRALSRYAPVPPQAWRFTLSRRGKPALAASGPTAPLWFNLSHTDTLSTCAVTGAGPGIGVDVEPLARGDNVLSIAEQFFPEAETHALLQLPTALRGQAFVRLWALKESFVKASGLSLADGLSGAAFDLSRPDDIAVTFDELCEEQPGGWQFRLVGLPPDHVVALAVRADRDGPLLLRAGPGLQD